MVLIMRKRLLPLTKMNTVRIILSLATYFDWESQHFDMKNAFLYGHLEEEVYRKLPLGLRSIQEGNKVCRLKKGLYGLRQSPDDLVW